MRRKGHGIEGTFCSCKKNGLSSSCENEKTLRNCSPVPGIKQSIFVVRFTTFSGMEGRTWTTAPEFSGLTRLAISLDISIGAFSRLCLSCAYRAESLVAEGVQDDRCPADVWAGLLLDEACCQQLRWAGSTGTATQGAKIGSGRSERQEWKKSARDKRR